MEKIPTPLIYKINIGHDLNPLNSFYVGQLIGKNSVSPIEITRIFRDETHFYFFGILRYIIYAKKKEGNEFMFKYISGMPVMVTLDSDSKNLI